MAPDQRGPDHPGASWRPSPNSGPRRDGLTPALIVLHYTAMESAQAALERLCDPVAEVSAHYLIGSDGTLWQLVAEAGRAWHAGAGEWCGLADINSRSIGIELDNRGNHPFSAPQMAALEDLMQGIMQRWSIPPAGVIGHSCMAPGRKADPGPRFDWARLARQGLAAERGNGGAPQGFSFDHFRKAAHRAGFTAPAEDDALLAAVRLRFRPWARGPLAAEDFPPLGCCGL
ncbi:N-acetylmuramoyl-L-alanine amidase [Leisingera methylohalidivorans]|uniref:N-acetylmuramoyl-L-alanine amidase n=1 Tax=Leisingera methylohalidivorans DSM 14336 TaxID=999552 RepID=V9VSN7_9RHOB|nr:N-acetylmuramoyl-L-alanine amidase [Leisingera methylohalidivorans]AHD00325.1 N-acetylmuramoyl-L-alanine amidase [Leisingera methylohalidivorans DSM 14336]